jgi:ParB-like nuclease domain
MIGLKGGLQDPTPRFPLAAFTTNHSQGINMSRRDFRTVRNVSISSIDLDVKNARIRAGQDQSDCIQRILRKEDQLLALAEDIAEKGLSTMPILVSPEALGRYVVRDGNRRITALKLLNDPARWSPDARLKDKFAAIRRQYLSNIPKNIDILSSDNEEAIVREVILRHSGANGGIGQLDWSAFLRTVYLVTHDLPAEYKRPGQYAFWAEDNGINVGDDFPISSLQRFFSKENLTRLGFDIDENDKLKANLRLDVVKKIASTVMGDFEFERVKVADVFTPTDAATYITRVRAMHGLVHHAPTSTAPAQAPMSGGSPAPGPTPPPALGAPTTPSSPVPNPSQAPRPAPTPATPPSDRKKLFGRSAPGIAIPEKEVKAATIVVELRRMDLDETPFAASMLLRALIEISDAYYRKNQQIADKGSLAKNVAASTDSMSNRQMLSASQHAIVKAMTGGPGTMLQIDTLQKMLHRDTHHTNKQLANTMWDNIGCFIQACWR